MLNEKKECILLAASKIFTRFGFKKTSVNEIAESAGVAKGTVYLACQSKEDLFYQVLHREVRDWVADCAKVIDPRKPADELLLPVLMTGLELFEKRPLAKELFSGTYHASMPSWEDRLDELRVLGRSTIVEVLELGVRQGAFRPELNVPDAARSLQDLQISAYQFQRPGKEGAESIRGRLESSLKLLLFGLRQAAAAV